MTKEEIGFNLFQPGLVSWPNSETSLSENQTENPQALNECEKDINGKFKTTAKNVLRKIKSIAKGLFIDDSLPNPENMPIEIPSVTNFRPVVIPEGLPFSVDEQGEFQEEILHNNSLSKKGFCVLYRDKTQNYRVEEISNEFSCRGFFDWFSCYHLMPDSVQIVIFDINMKVAKAFNYLCKSNSRAAPIWDSEKNEFIAMLTITDFIRFLHKYYRTDTSKIEEVLDHTINDWISDLKIKDKVQFIYLSPESNLKYAVSTIGLNNIHRLPVLNPYNGNILCILTNSQLFRFFFQRFMKQCNLLIPDYMYRTPTNLGLGQFKRISTIHPWQTIYEAFDIFMNNQISVLPVVDEDQKLIDIYARYDVVALAAANMYKNLDLPISEGLKLRKLLRPPCTCNKEDSLEKIINNIYEAQVHRVFIVDEEKHILGVISLSDILAFLCEM